MVNKAYHYIEFIDKMSAKNTAAESAYTVFVIYVVISTRVSLICCTMKLVRDKKNFNEFSH